MAKLRADWIKHGYGVPTVCSRHGEPPVKHSKTQFISKPPPWAPLFILAGIIGYIIVVMATRKTATVANWPFCRRCGALKLQRMLIGFGALAVGVVVFFGAIGSDDSGGGGLLAVIGFALLLVGVIVSSLSSSTAIAGGVVTRDGLHVEFRKADPRFIAQTEALAAYRDDQQAYKQQLDQQYQQLVYQQQVAQQAGYAQPVPPQQYPPAAPQQQYGQPSQPFPLASPQPPDAQQPYGQQPPPDGTQQPTFPPPQ